MVFCACFYFYVKQTSAIQWKFEETSMWNQQNTTMERTRKDYLSVHWRSKDCLKWKRKNEQEEDD